MPWVNLLVHVKKPDTPVRKNRDEILGDHIYTIEKSETRK